MTTCLGLISASADGRFLKLSLGGKVLGGGETTNFFCIRSINDSPMSSSDESSIDKVSCFCIGGCGGTTTFLEKIGATGFGITGACFFTVGLRATGGLTIFGTTKEESESTSIAPPFESDSVSESHSSFFFFFAAIFLLATRDLFFFCALRSSISAACNAASRSSKAISTASRSRNHNVVGSVACKSSSSEIFCSNCARCCSAFSYVSDQIFMPNKYS